MIQVGRIMNVELIDHLIITESSYYSFANSGLLEELSRKTSGRKRKRKRTKRES